MKLSTTILFLFFCISLFAQSGKVVKVKDGDTIVVLDGLDFMHTIRVADIDCPEKGQPFSNKAKLFVSNEIFGQYVTIKYKGIDRYGRTIGYVLYEDKNLSLELLKKGLAWHYSKYSDDREMAELEKTARRLKIGLWSEIGPVEPHLWRKNKNVKNSFSND